ncbi:MAG: hypothetical protein Q4B77_04620 [Coriobacteriaceae bacterium]|nr:hypothetical protein [Coriobacteriaceae bacterium]
MGLIQKKDEDKDLEFVDGVEVIGRGEGPEPDQDGLVVELHEGLTAEDISGTTAAREAERELTADPELLEDVEDEGAEVEGAEVEAEAAEAEDAAEDLDVVDADAEAEPVAHDEALAEIEAAEEAEGAAESAAAPEAPHASAMSKRHTLYIAGAVVAVVAAGVLGFCAGSGTFTPKGVGATSMSEEQLDTPVATMKYAGDTIDITARQAIETQYSVSAVEQDDKYPSPSADMVLGYARNQVLLKEAAKQGIELSDKELKKAAEKQLGTSDFKAIAEQYQVSEDQAKQIVREQTLIQMLYGKVVKNAPSAMPEAPVEPENGDAAAASKEYAEYIIKLAGDEWDAEKKTWASEDGPVAFALSGQKFNPESATYDQAKQAYTAVAQEYSAQAAKASQQWTEYVNELFAHADIEIYGLFA